MSVRERLVLVALRREQRHSKSAFMGWACDRDESWGGKKKENWRKSEMIIEYTFVQSSRTLISKQLDEKVSQWMPSYSCLISTINIGNEWTYKITT